MRFRTAAPAVLSLLAACDASAPAAPPGAACASPLTLRVGEVRSLSGAESVGCIELTSGSTATAYTLVLVNTATTPDQLLRVQLQRSGGAAATRRTEDHSLTVRPERPALGGAAVHAQGSALQASLEDRVRRKERDLDPRAFLPVRSGRQALPRAPAETSREPLALGDVQSFRVGRANAPDLCAQYAVVRARIRAIGTRIVIAEDLSTPVGGFTDADIGALADEFDRIVYPTLTSWFGSPSDIDANGRVTVLFTPEINRLTPPGSLGFASGFFFAGDFSARTGVGACAASNEQEILYLLAPDPNGQVNGNRFSIERATESARGTIAHELQHLVNLGVRRTRDATARQESVWLDEGLSHFAEEVAGRAVLGYSDARSLTWPDVFSDLDVFDSYFRQNLLRLRLWMEAPEQSSPVSALAGVDLASRGAAWLFVRHLVDRFGGTSPRAFTRALAAGPDTAIANLVLRTRAPFEQLVEPLMIAALAETVLPAPLYRIPSLELGSLMRELNGAVYPLRPNALTSVTPLAIRSGSAAYSTVEIGAGDPPAILQVQDPNGRSVNDPHARVVIIRIR